jgi:hypothetical protein
MKKLIIIFIVLFSTITKAQNTTKKFKYAIVPVQYGFLAEPNQFQLNVLTRVLLKEAGFEVYMSEGEEMPKDLRENSCLALKANVIKEKGIFASNLLFQLKNCYGNVVYESRGTSRLKAFNDAYKEALRSALDEFIFVSSQYVEYSSEKKEETEVSTTTNNDEVEIPFTEKAEKYTISDRMLWLLKSGDNYTFYEDEGVTIYATLSQADRGTYAFDSADIDGAAYFNANGDVIVEYLAKDKIDLQKMTFTKVK